MTENNIENADSQNSETQHSDLESLDVDALREIVVKERAEKQELATKNRQLYARAKKVESKKDDGETKSDYQSTKSEPNESVLLAEIERLHLKTANVTAEDEINLARDFQKRTGLPISEVLSDDIFQAKLEKLRETKANVSATSGVTGGNGQSNAKNSPEYWIAKGVPPTPDQVPNRKVRAEIARAMMSNAKSSKTFYND